MRGEDKITQIIYYILLVCVFHVNTSIFSQQVMRFLEQEISSKQERSYV